MYFRQAAKAFKALVEELKGKEVVVLGHTRPDGDCVGSQVALCRVLNQLGVQATALNQDDVPRTLLPFIGDTPWAKPEEFSGGADIAITVDCADPIRPGSVLNERFPVIRANIDHHISNTGYGKLNLIEDYTSATAEILAGIFVDLELTIDAVTAEALYVGIMTDTGQFRFPSTSPQVFKICSDLIDRGANPSRAAQLFYENESLNKLSLLQHFLKTLQLECEGRVCIGHLNQDAFRETGALRDDSEGFVNYARAIEGVDLGVLIEERDGGIKCSLRAKESKYRVDQIAQQFAGGGHACAAGLNQKETTIEAFYPKILEALKNHLAALGA